MSSFVNIGDVLKIDTRTGEYLSREPKWIEKVNDKWLGKTCFSI